MVVLNYDSAERLNSKLIFEQDVFFDLLSCKSTYMLQSKDK